MEKILKISLAILLALVIFVSTLYTLNTIMCLIYIIRDNKMFPIFNVTIAAVILTFVIFVSTLIILYRIIK